MHEVLVNRLGGLSLPRKSVVRLTDRPDMTLDVYGGRKTTIQQQQLITVSQETEFFKKQSPCECSVRCEKKPRQTRSSEIRYYRCYQM